MLNPMAGTVAAMVAEEAEVVALPKPSIVVASFCWCRS